MCLFTSLILQAHFPTFAMIFLTVSFLFFLPTHPFLPFHSLVPRTLLPFATPTPTFTTPFGRVVCDGLGPSLCHGAPPPHLCYHRVVVENIKLLPGYHSSTRVGST